MAGHILTNPDFLSLYTDAEGTTLPHWEPEILNSYSLSFDLAERFMVFRKNQRRAKITGTYEKLENRLGIFYHLTVICSRAV